MSKETNSVTESRAKEFDDGMASNHQRYWHLVQPQNLFTLACFADPVANRPDIARNNEPPSNNPGLQKQEATVLGCQNPRRWIDE